MALEVLSTGGAKKQMLPAESPHFDARNCTGVEMVFHRLSSPDGELFLDAVDAVL